MIRPAIISIDAEAFLSWLDSRPANPETDVLIVLDLMRLSRALVDETPFPEVRPPWILLAAREVS